MWTPQHVRILDIGCGGGGNLRLLRQAGHEAIGVTLSEVEARVCREQGFACHVADLTQNIPFEPGSFDGLLLSHVLEHFPFPDEVLKRLLLLLRPEGGVYVALPNVLYLRQRLEFLRGRFRYAETGIMDRTHVRFFDFASARLLLETCGVTVNRHFGVGHFPLGGTLRSLAPGLCQEVDRFVIKNWPGLFGIHLICTGSYRPSAKS